jgi:dipeptidyl aminopeptidase/acylaminoacyl peptidase
MTTTAPYGSWASRITVEALTTATAGLSAVRIDGDKLYWLESHADQAGRTGLWRRAVAGGVATEVTPAPAYVRNRVHEYGGGEYAVRDGLVVYTEYGDGRVYRVVDGAPPQPVTPTGAFRYGDLRLHPDRQLVLAVREDHTAGGEPVNTVVSLDLTGANDEGGTVLCAGADFYSTPELSKTGRLAWTQWSHPDMPWDSSQVMVGSFSASDVTDVTVVAGGPGESAMQPRWLGDQLILLSDRTGWWNLYRWGDRDLVPLHRENAEFAFPQWNLGQDPYAVLGQDHLVCTICRSGSLSVAVLSVSTGDLVQVTDDRVGAVSVAAASGRVAAVLSHPDRSPAVALLDSGRRWSEVRAAAPVIMPADECSIAEPVSWPGPEGLVHGWLYPPTNPDFVAPAGTRPPLLVLSHGGPTGFAAGMFSVAYQFWTSRGFAVLDVNYGGSAGFGRDYRERLRGQWGVVDARDCINGALAMVNQGRAERRQLAIKGASAGGYTTLRVLTTSTVFAAGISQFGIGDLEALAKDTHKFESRYLDGLVGPYPRAREIYLDRSPINHVDQLAAPILLLQGSDDRVVPPGQAEMMAEAARAKGLPVAMIMYDGEGHGFRRAETIISATNAQVYFLGRVFGHTPADDVPPIPIDNLAW